MLILLVKFILDLGEFCLDGLFILFDLFNFFIKLILSLLALFQLELDIS
jgi:hypothetical protein